MRTEQANTFQNFLALDIGGTWIKAAWLVASLQKAEGSGACLSLQILRRMRQPSTLRPKRIPGFLKHIELSSTESHVLGAPIFQNLACIYEGLAPSPGSLLAVAVPGCVDRSSTQIHSIGNIPDLEGQSLAKLFAWLTQAYFHNNSEILPQNGTEPPEEAIDTTLQSHVPPSLGRTSWQGFRMPLDKGQLSRIRLKTNSHARFSMPQGACTVDNDLHLATIGEYHFGSGRGTSHFLHVALGTGIGAGLVLGGKCYRGTHNYAGELGHFPYSLDSVGGGHARFIEAQGPCSCGSLHCLENYASARAMLRDMKALLSLSSDSDTQADRYHSIDMEWICKQATLGLPAALQIVQRTIQAIAFVLSGVARLLDLDRISLGGGVAQIMGTELLLRPLSEQLQDPKKKRSSQKARHLNFELVLGELGDDAAILGAALSTLLDEL